MNARSETAAELRISSGAFRQRRCVVPADRFFEWRGGRGDRRPLRFHPPEGGLLLFATLAFEDQDAPAFVILTTAANALVRPVHDRMPVLLSLVPAAESSLAVREVSEAVKDVANDRPELLEAPRPKRQLRLSP